MEFREITERYRLEKILKSAKSGTVLRAFDTQWDRTVVVKLIPVGSAPNLEQRMAAFGRLAAAIGALGHPALPVVLDSGITPDGSAFLVLEHLEGGRGLDTLAGVAPNRALPLLMQAVSGLEALAGQRVPYLNLSPDNVLVIPGPAGDPVGEQAKLLGLGTVLFQPLGGPGDEARRFRAPELLSPQPGERADARADLYSLAVTACHVLGATIAGNAPDPAVQMPLALSFELENAEALRQMLERCLRRRPAERPSHQAVRYAFQLALEGSDSPLWQPAAAVAVAPEKPERMAAPEPAPAPQPAPASAPAVAPTPLAAPIAAPIAGPIPMPAPAPPPPPVPMPPPASVMASAAPAPAVSPAPAVPPAATIPAAAVPVPSLPEPAPLAEGDILSAVDDELLNALTAPPPPPAPAAKPAKPAAGSGRVLPFLRRSRPAPAPAAEGTPAGDAVPAVPARSRRPLILGVAAALLLVAAVAVLWIMLREPATVSTPAPVVVAAAPPKPPRRPAAERLEEARLLIAAGEDDQARQILRAFTADDEAALPPSACRLLDGLRETLVLAARDRLPNDLSSGLDGNLVRLRAAVETGTEQPDVVAALPAEAQAGFDRARRTIDLYTQAETAARDGQHPLVLERLAAVLELSPKLVDPQELRKKSADALEAEAEKLVEAGRYPEALAKLEPLRRTWPDRLGLAARVSSYEGYQKDAAEQKKILEALPSVERRRKPHEALEVLATVKPVPHLAPQFAQARARFENQLAELDKQPPKVVLREGYALTYPRGAGVTLSFRATDDYEVRSVKLMLRPPGGKMRSMPMESTRMGHTIEIPPSLHQNGTVELYVTATDRSGHEGSLGSAAQPLQLTREQGFERIVR